ncbi:hypothetical protein E2C01_090214 [Portunus trituberculatus]|uniref:Uncharacterized protein n=1 Tax=Portunus trituberculatus TaxID=210409 RepID=A0A5B7JFT5_PORTR|nr:hypothetical protein [Portunus trituberculatus]
MLFCCVAPSFVMLWSCCDVVSSLRYSEVPCCISGVLSGVAVMDWWSVLR